MRPGLRKTFIRDVRQYNTVGTMPGTQKKLKTQSELQPEPRPIELNEILRKERRERVLTELDADYFGRDLEGHTIIIHNIDWVSRGNKIYAVVNATITDTGERTDIAFSGRVVKDQLKIIEKTVREGIPVKAHIVLRESKNGNKYICLV